MATKLPDFSTSNRILAVKLSSLGDIVHVTPCLESIRRAFPRAEVVVAVEARFSALVRYNPNVDVVLEALPGRSNPFFALSTMLREFRKLPAKPFEMAIDFQGTKRSAAWVYASRSRIKTGRGRARPGWDFAYEPDLSRHAVDVCAEVAEKSGINVSNRQPQIFLAEREDEKLASLLKDMGLPEAGFILVNPFSRAFAKIWPLERYARLISLVRKDVGLPVLITGGPGEERMGDALIRLLEPGAAFSLVGRLSLAQSLCLFKRAELMVTSDSGPMHAAAALGTKLVALFGPTLPERTGPRGSNCLIIQALRPRSHHAHRHEPERKYMSAIEVESVFQAMMSILKK